MPGWNITVCRPIITVQMLLGGHQAHHGVRMQSLQCKLHANVQCPSAVYGMMCCKGTPAHAFTHFFKVLFIHD